MHNFEIEIINIEEDKNVLRSSFQCQILADQLNSLRVFSLVLLFLICFGLIMTN